MDAVCLVCSYVPTPTQVSWGRWPACKAVQSRAWVKEHGVRREKREGWARLDRRENWSATVKAWSVLLREQSLSLDYGEEGLKEDVAYLVSAVALVSGHVALGTEIVCPSSCD